MKEWSSLVKTRPQAALCRLSSSLQLRLEDDLLDLHLVEELVALYSLGKRHYMVEHEAAMCVSHEALQVGVPT